MKTRSPSTSRKPSPPAASAPAVAVAADGRTQRRTTSMRRIQSAALDLFDTDGYDATSVEAIATKAGVGPATVYRAFGSKEAIVLWDEYDPMLLQAFASHLEALSPADALLQAVTDSLAKVYAEDRVRILRRARLMRSVPAIERAATGNLAQLRAALADALESHRPRKVVRDALEASVFAAALVATLEVAIDRWLSEDGKTPLARCLKLAFARLARLFESTS